MSIDAKKTSIHWITQQTISDITINALSSIALRISRYALIAHIWLIASNTIDFIANIRNTNTILYSKQQIAFCTNIILVWAVQAVGNIARQCFTCVIFQAEPSKAEMTNIRSCAVLTIDNFAESTSIINYTISRITNST